MAEVLSTAWNGSIGLLSSVINTIAKPSKIEQVIIREVQMNPGAGAKTFIRLAGISGATAVCLGAYGSHGKT